MNLYAKHIGKSPEQIEEDIRRPKYFSPSEALDYGIIDKVQQILSGKIIIIVKKYARLLGVQKIFIVLSTCRFFTTREAARTGEFCQT